MLSLLRTLLTQHDDETERAAREWAERLHIGCVTNDEIDAYEGMHGHPVHTAGTPDEH
jgi:hypothetical protein